MSKKKIIILSVFFILVSLFIFIFAYFLFGNKGILTNNKHIQGNDKTDGLQICTDIVTDKIAEINNTPDKIIVLFYQELDLESSVEPYKELMTRIKEEDMFTENFINLYTTVYNRQKMWYVIVTDKGLTDVGTDVRKQTGTYEYNSELFYIDSRIEDSDNKQYYIISVGDKSTLSKMDESYYFYDLKFVLDNDGKYRIDEVDYRKAEPEEKVVN